MSKTVKTENFYFESNRDEVEKACAEAIYRSLEAVGLRAEGDVKQEITKPKKHKSWDKKHAKVRGSVDTGTLRNSITHEARPSQEAVLIGTPTEYASFVEFGTSKSPAYPFLRPALTNPTNVNRYKNIFETYLKGNGNNED